MAKETISQTEGLCKEAANCIRNAYDRGYKQGYKDGNYDKEFFCNLNFEHGTNKGLDDAWECLKKIIFEKDDGGLTFGEIAKIFDGKCLSTEILENYSASEAIAKIKEYEEKQKQDDDEVKVGDEVVWNDHVKGIVIEISDCNLRGFTSRLCPFEWRKEFCRKTGRHFDQIAEVLEQLKGEGECISKTTQQE